MIRRLAAIAALLCLLVAAPGLAEDEKPKSACPQCGEVAEGEKCASDSTPLVRADLVYLHNAILLGGGPNVRRPKGGHENPFLALVKDDDVDVEALEKLVADYKAARKKGTFKYVDLFDLIPGNEASAIAALKTLATSQAIFREGDKDQNGELDYGTLKQLGKTHLIDDVLASGEKNGYRFRCRPSTDKEKKCFCWWATATPIVPGRTGTRYYFINQAGVIYSSKKEIEIDDTIKEKCTVPEGMRAVGR